MPELFYASSAKNVGFPGSILDMPCLGDGTGRDRQHSLDATSNEH